MTTTEPTTHPYVDDPSEVGFARFMHAVDETLRDLVGCEAMDLPDVDYRGSFDGGESPADMAAGIVQDLEAGLI